MELGESITKGWKPDAGWKEVNLQVYNLMEFMPRMGYFFSDGVFDLGRVAVGKQKFVLKDAAELLSQATVEYKEY